MRLPTIRTGRVKRLEAALRDARKELDRAKLAEGYARDVATLHRDHATTLAGLIRGLDDARVEGATR